MGENSLIGGKFFLNDKLKLGAFLFNWEHFLNWGQMVANVLVEFEKKI